MIPFNERTTLTDALIPPAGMVFDLGVAATYSLDLMALLSLPLHLAWLGMGQASLDDPIRLVEGLRRVAGRLTVFSERGRLRIPDKPHQLYSLMEEMIHESAAPRGGAFHPKFWLLRFLPLEGDGPPRLRVLAGSRNLTRDNSWDLFLQLEGEVGRKRLEGNGPLARLISDLPGMTAKPLSYYRSEQIKTLSSEAWRCAWEPPGSFEQVRFHVLGRGGRGFGWLPDRCDELGVISPFLGPKALEQLASRSKCPLFSSRAARRWTRFPPLFWVNLANSSRLMKGERIPRKRGPGIACKVCTPRRTSSRRDGTHTFTSARPTPPTRHSWRGRT
jgi:hypothetical protein